jgi:hypothetical protein
MPPTSEAFLRGDTPIPRITALVVVRDALGRCGLFDERFTLAEDGELILRLLRHGAMASTVDVVDPSQAQLSSYLKSDSTVPCEYASSPAVSGYGRVGRTSKMAAASHLSMMPAAQRNTSTE